MVSSAKLLGVAILLGCMASSLSGQDNCRQRTVPVTVTDAHGASVQPLTAHDFKAIYRGHPLNILGVSHAQAQHRIVVLLDVSGSMHSIWPAAHAAATDLIASTDFRTPIALMAFSDKVQTAIDFSAGRQAVIRWLESNPVETPKMPQGKTAFYDTIVEAIKLLQPAQPGDTIYAVTDGGDNASHVSAQKATLALQSAGIRLMGICLTYPSLIETPEEDERGRKFFDLARDSGGATVQFSAIEPFADSRSPRFSYDENFFAKLKSTTATIEIREPYFLTVELPEDPAKPTGWRFEVVNAYGRSRKGMLVFYPHEVLPCPASSDSH